MKRITCVVAAILLLVFVVRGVILPIVNHAGGGSNKDAETVNRRSFHRQQYEGRYGIDGYGCFGYRQRGFRYGCNGDAGKGQCSRRKAFCYDSGMA